MALQTLRRNKRPAKGNEWSHSGGGPLVSRSFASVAAVCGLTEADRNEKAGDVAIAASDLAVRVIAVAHGGKRDVR